MLCTAAFVSEFLLLFVTGCTTGSLSFTFVLSESVESVPLVATLVVFDLHQYSALLFQFTMPLFCFSSDIMHSVIKIIKATS